MTLALNLPRSELFVPFIIELFKIQWFIQYLTLRISDVRTWRVLLYFILLQLITNIIYFFISRNIYTTTLLWVLFFIIHIPTSFSHIDRPFIQVSPVNLNLTSLIWINSNQDSPQPMPSNTSNAKRPLERDSDSEIYAKKSRLSQSSTKSRSSNPDKFFNRILALEIKYTQPNSGIDNGKWYITIEEDQVFSNQRSPESTGRGVVAPASDQHVLKEKLAALNSIKAADIPLSINLTNSINPGATPAIKRWLDKNVPDTPLDISQEFPHTPPRRTFISDTSSPYTNKSSPTKISSSSQSGISTQTVDSSRIEIPDILIKKEFMWDTVLIERKEIPILITGYAENLKYEWSQVYATPEELPTSKIYHIAQKDPTNYRVEFVDKRISVAQFLIEAAPGTKPITIHVGAEEVIKLYTKLSLNDTVYLDIDPEITKMFLERKLFQVFKNQNFVHSNIENDTFQHIIIESSKVQEAIQLYIDKVQYPWNYPWNNPSIPEDINPSELIIDSNENLIGSLNTEQTSTGFNDPTAAGLDQSIVEVISNVTQLL